MSSRATKVASVRPVPRARAWLRRLTTGTTAAGLLLMAAPFTGPAAGPAAGAATAPATWSLASVQHRHWWRGHPGRYLVPHTVRRGDTATGLAVRYHAWTAELITLNHLSHARLYVGQRLRIPVVAAAARKARRHRAHHHRAAAPRHAHRHAHRHAAHRHPAPAHHAAHHRRTPAGHGWRHADAGRATVRRAVERAAARYGVPPRLALAVAWQESGWQQQRVSSAGAIGVMQVMPATGRLMSLFVGHRLHLRWLHENVAAGVMLLHLLRGQADGRRVLAGYYQGLTSVRQHGMYPSTRRYVANVQAIRHRLQRGWDPA